MLPHLFNHHHHFVGLFALLPRPLQGFLDWFCLTGRGYEFFSGIGLALFWPLVYFWHHNCRGHPLCLRLGHLDPKTHQPRCHHHRG